MNRFDSFITVGWENITASPEVTAAGLLDPDDKGYAPPFRIDYRPPECSWLDAWIMNYCEAQPAS